MSAMSEQERGRGGQGGPPWVAVVDDDGAVRTAIARVLRAHGIPAGAFATANEFLAASAAGTRPSCLVLDVHLSRASGMTGFELREYLAASGSGVPVILMTGHDDPGTNEQLRRAGADGFLHKPFDGDELLARVRRHLEGAGTP